LVSIKHYFQKNAKISIDLPNHRWALNSKQVHKGMTLYNYKREPIKDSQDRNVIPNISVITEKVDKKLDVVIYYAYKRFNLPLDVDSIFIHESGIIDFKKAIGFIGRYQDEIGEHKIYYVIAINNNTGVRIILDVTSELFDELDGEFKKTLKSISNIYGVNRKI